jgi:hypothetical protein
MILVAIGTLAPAAAAWGAVAVSVGPNVNITRENGNQAEGTIAIDPTNGAQLFAANNPPGALFFPSTTGGGAWTPTPTAVPGAHCCDNVATFDGFANLFLTNIASSGSSIPIFVSTNGGATFSGPTTIDNTGKIDQPSVDAGAGAVWVTWNDGSCLAVCVIKARGAPVTGAGTVGAFIAEQAAPGAASVTGQFGDIAISPGGSVVVTYQSGAANGPGSIYVNTDADGLGSGGFGSQVLVTATNVGKFDSITPQDNRTVDAEANLAYDRGGGPNRGRLYLAYTDESPDESNNTDIFVRSSNDDGATWSPAVRVNDDATTRAQFNPSISVDQTTGNVAVTWHDARNDPANNNTEFWGAVSDDGGASFGANFKISAGVSNDDVAGSIVDYGDYTTSDFNAGALFPIWADNSNSTADNPAGANATFDMYTAKIVVTPARPALDHYKCYAVRARDDDNDDDDDRSDLKVTLKDQFGRHDARIGSSQQLCNPVSKNGAPINQKDAHLLQYRIGPVPATFAKRRVEVKNQFGSQILEVRRPETLAVPSSKSTTGTPGAPPTLLDHFECYPVGDGGEDDDDDTSAGFTPRTVVLKDQFKEETVRVTRPSALCNPVEKTRDGKVTPIGSAKEHLVCYAIKAAKAKRLDVTVRNQFGDTRLRVGDPASLCVPSEKRVLPPP